MALMHAALAAADRMEAGQTPFVDPAEGKEVTDRRDVVIKLTPWAPGMAHLSSADDARDGPAWIRAWNVAPRQVMATVLQKLQRGPRAVSAQMGNDGTVEILGTVEGHRDPQPLALVAFGLRVVDIRETLEALAGARK